MLPLAVFKQSTVRVESVTSCYPVGILVNSVRILSLCILVTPWKGTHPRHPVTGVSWHLDVDESGVADKGQAAISGRSLVLITRSYQIVKRLIDVDLLNSIATFLKLLETRPEGFLRVSLQLVPLVLEAPFSRQNLSLPLFQDHPVPPCPPSAP